MRIHMVGVGGISMRALARYLVDAGHTVSGCDVNSLTLLRYPEDPQQVEVRRLLGFPIDLGHDANHIVNVDRVIINSAITESHPGWVEVVAAKKHGIPVLKRAQQIGEITRGRPTIALSGTHGKTTTTGMLAHILLKAQQDPFVMIGARVTAYGGQSYRAGAGPLVLEADEFDRSFFEFSPQVAVLTNIEADHLDYYTGGIAEIIETFAQFLLRVRAGGTVILHGDDERIREAYASVKDQLIDRTIVWYGRTGSNLDYRIEAVEAQGAQQNAFRITTKTDVVTCSLAIPGNFNQDNATAVIAAANVFGVPTEAAVAALADYTGVDMRFEQLYDQDGLTIVSDYGHHPTEVQVTCDAAKAWFAGRPLTLVFQPHQYARTKLLFPQFVDALMHADHVVVTDIYGVAGREEQAAVSSQQLVEALQARGSQAAYVPLANLAETLMAATTKPGVYLLMGAGLDIRLVAEQLAAALPARHG